MRPTIHQLLARYIRHRMAVAGMVQVDLAKKLRMSQPGLSQLLSLKGGDCKRRRWSLEILQRVGGIFGLSLEELIAAARAFRPPRLAPRMAQESERARTTKGISNEDRS